jgi:hypothetical protein
MEPGKRGTPSSPLVLDSGTAAMKSLLSARRCGQRTPGGGGQHQPQPPHPKGPCPRLVFSAARHTPQAPAELALTQLTG